jgi:hypothetical protein
LPLCYSFVCLVFIFIFIFFRIVVFSLCSYFERAVSLDDRDPRTLFQYATFLRYEWLFVLPLSSSSSSICCCCFRFRV